MKAPAYIDDQRTIAARIRLEAIGLLLVQIHLTIHAKRKTAEVRLELVAGLLDQVCDKLNVALPDMTRTTITTEAVARAAAQDAGNRSAKAAGRTTWTAEDYNAAARAYNNLIPEPKDGTND